MYVRWKQRSTQWGEMRVAVLVRSVRVGGNPRQQIVARLGTIEPRYCNAEQHSVAGRLNFWEAVDLRIWRLRLDQVETDLVVSSVERTVPRPTKAREGTRGRNFESDRREKCRMEACERASFVVPHVSQCTCAGALLIAHTPCTVRGSKSRFDRVSILRLLSHSARTRVSTMLVRPLTNIVTGFDLRVVAGDTGEKIGFRWSGLMGWNQVNVLNLILRLGSLLVPTMLSQHGLHFCFGACGS